MIFPVVYLLTPFTALIQNPLHRYMVFLTLMFIKGIAVIVAFPCTTIMLTNSATSVRILGTLNGFATSFSGLGRAIGPALTGAIFSIGVQRGYIIAPWWFLAGIAAVGAIPSLFIIEGDGPTRCIDTDSDGEEEETLVSDRGDSDNEGDFVDDEACIEGLLDGDGSGSEEEDGDQKSLKRRSKYGTVN